MMSFNDQSFYSTPKNIAELISHELEQFRDNGAMRWKDYHEKRIRFLNSLPHGEEAVAYLNAFKPNIGVFAGSFNPFHKGHYNVLQKAEKIFDKVIVAFGQNPEKNAHKFEVPRTIKNRQIERYDGLLTDFIGSLGHDAVVVRGLRNSTDFQYEQNQYRYIQELMPEIRIVNIFCDKEFEHISSSGIRTLQKYNRHQEYLLD